MEKQKYYLGIAVSIGIISIVACGILVWQGSNMPIASDPIAIPTPQSDPQTQDQPSEETGIVVDEPVEEWKTCKNQENGYKVKYPSEWEIGIRGPYGFESRDECNVGNMNFGKYERGVGFDYYIKIESLRTQDMGVNYANVNSLEDYFEQRAGIVKNSPIIETFFLGNAKAVYLKKSPNPSIYSFHNKRVFQISGKNISQETLDDILSTFTFLD
jgi:hypothetical protein